jgi:hypothetical protein
MREEIATTTKRRDTYGMDMNWQQVSNYKKADLPAVVA